MKDNFSLDVTQSTATCDVSVLKKSILKYSFKQLFDLCPIEFCDSVHMMNDSVPFVKIKNEKCRSHKHKKKGPIYKWDPKL